MHSVSSPREAVESLSEPIEFIDRKGNPIKVRIFKWMKHYGVLDDTTGKVIVPALRRHRCIRVFPDLKLIVGGSSDTGWQVYSPDGTRLANYGKMNLDKLQKILKNWGR